MVGQRNECLRVRFLVNGMVGMGCRAVDVTGHGDIMRQEREGEQKTEQRPVPPPSAPATPPLTYLLVA
jgi:hypothetical protein